MQIPIFKVDAFANRPFTGNPAAVCVLDRWLDDENLQQVAAENNLSATAFLVPRGEVFELRWFTTRCEIRLCGHATLASGYIVLNFLSPGLAKARFETRFAGAVSVAKEGELFAMDFPAASPKKIIAPRELLDLFEEGTAKETLEANQIYVVACSEQSAIETYRPDFARLERLHPHALVISAPGSEVDFVSRYFAPGYGIPEDPVTGSSHSVLAPYWAERLGKSVLHARQLSERGGELYCEVKKDRVLIKGNAVLTFQGSLFL